MVIRRRKLYSSPIQKREYDSGRIYTFNNFCWITIYNLYDVRVLFKGKEIR
jgi:hypothetical protein